MMNDRKASGAGAAPPDPEDPTNRAMMMARPGSSMQRTALGAITAMKVQVPRDIKRVKTAAVEEATELAGDAYYSWEVNDKTSPTGKSLVKGPSVECAMMLARVWTNTAHDVGVDDEGPGYWQFKALFVDLEAGFAAPRLYRQSKPAKFGNMDPDRARDVEFQKGQSKAIRNTIIHAMPAWLVRAVLDAATIAAEKEFSDLQVSYDKAVKGWARLNVTEPMLIKKLGKPVEQWLARDFALLLGLWNGIKSGVTNVAIEFGSASPTEEEGTAPEDEAAAPAPAPAPASSAYARGPSTPARPAPPPPTPVPPPKAEPKLEDLEPGDAKKKAKGP